MNNTKQHAPARAAYTKPTLKEFGYVGMLTQAGTAATTELMVNMMSSMSMTRDRA